MILVLEDTDNDYGSAAPQEGADRSRPWNAPFEIQLILWRRFPFRRRFLLGTGEVPVLRGRGPWADNSSKQRSKKKPRRTPAPGLKMSKPRWLPRTSVINVAQPWACSCGEAATRSMK
jgi:hypothetical protein